MAARGRRTPRAAARRSANGRARRSSAAVEQDVVEVHEGRVVLEHPRRHRLAVQALLQLVERGDLARALDQQLAVEDALEASPPRPGRGRCSRCRRRCASRAARRRWWPRSGPECRPISTRPGSWRGRPPPWPRPRLRPDAPASGAGTPAPRPPRGAGRCRPARRTGRRRAAPGRARPPRSRPAPGGRTRPARAWPAAPTRPPAAHRSPASRAPSGRWHPACRASPRPVAATRPCAWSPAPRPPRRASARAVRPQAPATSRPPSRRDHRQSRRTSRTGPDRSGSKPARGSAPAWRGRSSAHRSAPPAPSRDRGRARCGNSRPAAPPWHCAAACRAGGRAVRRKASRGDISQLGAHRQQMAHPAAGRKGQERDWWHCQQSPPIDELALHDAQDG